MVGISPMIDVSPLELKNIVQKLSTAYGVQAMNQTNKIVQAIFARMNSISIYNLNENSTLCIKTWFQTAKNYIYDIVIICQIRLHTLLW